MVILMDAHILLLVQGLKGGLIAFLLDSIES